MRSQWMVRLTTAICLLLRAAMLADTVTLAIGEGIQGIITK
jgi:hypothetical protein